MNSLIAIIAGALLLGAQHSPMSAAMGFDQEAARHHFSLASTGGSIEVTVTSGADTQTLTAVRAHLRGIADEFARGQFDKPFQTHGEMPPGVAAMQANVGAIAFRYEDVPDGGAVRIETNDAGLLQAVHEFLRYQITEHHTGDSLDVKR